MPASDLLSNQTYICDGCPYWTIFLFEVLPTSTCKLSTTVSIGTDSQPADGVLESLITAPRCKILSFKLEIYWITHYSLLHINIKYIPHSNTTTAQKTCDLLASLLLYASLSPEGLTFQLENYPDNSLPVDLLASSFWACYLLISASLSSYLFFYICFYLS